jgi:hypothetical protein
VGPETGSTPGQVAKYCLCGLEIAGGISILCHLWSLRVGQEVAPSAFGSHPGVALARASLQLEGKLSFPAFSDPLLSGSDLKGRGFKEWVS